MSLAGKLWDLRRDRPGFVFLSLLTVSAMVVWPAVDAWLRQIEAIHVAPYGFNDFTAYGFAVESWLAGEPIYIEQEDGGYHGSYLYPPVVLPVFYPFTRLGFGPGAVVFGLFSIFLLWVAIEGIVETFGYRLSVPERIVSIFALFGFHPILWDFKWGQVSTLLAAILCFAFYAHERGRQPSKQASQSDPRRVRTGTRLQYISGILTTLGSSFKLFYAPAGAHLLRSKDRFVPAVVTGVVLIALSLLVFGVSTNRTYLDVLAWGKGWGTEQFAPVQRQVAYYRPLYLVDQFVATFGIQLPSVWVIVATVLGVLGVTWVSLAARDEPAAARPTFALGVAVIPLFAPRAYTHDLIVLLLPAIILLAVELERDDGLPWVPVLAVLLVHVHSVGTGVTIHLLGRADAVFVQPGVYGTFLLVGLAAVRVAEHTGAPAATSRFRRGISDRIRRISR